MNTDFIEPDESTEEVEEWLEEEARLKDEILFDKDSSHAVEYRALMRAMPEKVRLERATIKGFRVILAPIRIFWMGAICLIPFIGWVSGVVYRKGFRSDNIANIRVLEKHGRSATFYKVMNSTVNICTILGILISIAILKHAFSD